MTRITLTLAAIAAAFFITAFVCVLVIHSILLLIRLSLIAVLACVVIAITRAVSGFRQGVQK